MGFPTISQPASTMPSDGLWKALLRLVVCIAAVFTVTAVLYAIPLRDRPLAAVLVFLFAALIVSALWGFRYAVFILLISALAFSWLLPPVGRFWLNNSRDVFALVAFLAVGATTSYLSGRVRKEAVTAKWRHAEAMEAETRFRTFVDHATDALFVHSDDQARVVDVNRQACETLGYTREELIGALPSLFDPAADAEFHQGVIQQLETRDMCTFEAFHRRKDGTEFPVEVRLRKFWHSGRRFLLSLARNISDAKRAEQARQEIEELWRAAFESNPTMYFIVDAAGNIESVNTFGAEQLGYKVDELVGQPVLSIFYEPDREAVQGHANACFQQPGKMMRWEARKICKDGAMIWVRETANAVFLKNRPVLLVVCENITVQKRAEEALRRSEAYLAEGQRLSHTGSWAYDPRSGKMLYCSDEMYRIYGLDPQESPPFLEELIQRMHPEDRDRVRADSFRPDGQTERILEFRLLLPDGLIKYVRSMRHPVSDSGGELVEIIGTTIDVTDRRRAERELQRSESYLAEAQRLTHTGSWAYSPAAEKAIYWSEEAFRIFGLDPQRKNPPDPQEFQLLQHPDDRDRFYQRFQKALNARVDFAGEYRILLPDGIVKYIQQIGHPVLDENAGFAEYVGTMVDITERKLAEQERERLRQLEADLAHMNRVSMMGELAASLAHEIKQPITAAATDAKTCLRWLQREPPDLGEARETALRIVQGVNRAAEIIDRNRSLYGRGTQKHEMVNPNEIVREMINLLHDVANRHSISVRAELDDGVPSITVDRVQVQQVLMNLMVNGIEAMKGPGGELTVGSKKTDDGQILFSVSDLGIGLPVDNPERIFDAFFTTKAQGTGMGLSISRRIIESHGGRLWASANSGKGATFYVILPAKPQSVEMPTKET
ncbi:MAG TPA: PAS domain S-box protein [Candidatus Angelobacter sp.]|jgi:PAS domain S-box-containing protein